MWLVSGIWHVYWDFDRGAVHASYGLLISDMISAIFGMPKMVHCAVVIFSYVGTHSAMAEFQLAMAWLYSVPPRFRNLSKPSLLSIVLSHHLLQCSFMVGGNIGNLSIGYQRTLPVKHCLEFDTKSSQFQILEGFHQDLASIA